ncbi:MAG: acyltransferase [Bacteroidales bacterium]|nr:acyltransferase [Bacteroidales bacterium]
MKRLYKRLRRFYLERFAGPARLLEFYRSQGIKIGENCHIGGLIYTDEAYLIEIGDHVAIAADVLFITHDPGMWCFTEDDPEYDVFGQIKIGNNVLIGMRCTILPNTFIGDNCIVGAGSVVRGKFPDNSIIFGNPATVVSNMSVQRLLYNQNPNRLKTARMTDEEKKPIVKKHFGLE